MSSPVPGAVQHPEAFGIGRLFWLTGEAIVGADAPAGRIVLWNPAAVTLFGYTEDEAIGMPLATLVPAELRTAHLAGIERYVRDGVGRLVGGDPVEVPAARKDGTPLIVSLTLAATDPRHVVAIIRDITELRTVVDDQRRTTAAVREFVAAASHDLRTPLALVLGYSELLLDGLGDEAARHEWAGAIHRAAQRATRLVGDLLTLSQIDANVVDTYAEAVAVRPVAAEALAGTDRAEVAVAEEVTALVDRDHLMRILANLVTNAQRYGAPPIRIEGEARGEHVEVRVIDSGGGVAADFVPRLFNRFSRTGAAADSAGLGLSIVKGLVEANGGEVFYDRDESSGTSRFGIRLPSG